MIKAQIPIELEMDERHQDLPVAKASLMGMGEVLMWKSNENDALAAFEQCKPDRTVEGNGLVAFWSKGETYCATIRELKKLKDQGKLFPLNEHLSVELGGYVDSPDLAALVHGKGLVPETAGSEGHGVGPTVEIFVHEKNGSQETKYRIVRFAQLPYLPEGKHPAGFYAEFYHPQVKGQVDILIGPGDKLAYRAWQQKLGRVVASGDLDNRQDRRHVFDGGRRERHANDAHAVRRECRRERQQHHAERGRPALAVRQGGPRRFEVREPRRQLDRPGIGPHRARDLLAQAESSRTVGERAAAASPRDQCRRRPADQELVQRQADGSRLRAEAGRLRSGSRPRHQDGRAITRAASSRSTSATIPKSSGCAKRRAPPAIPLKKQALRDELDRTIQKRTDDYLAVLQGKTETEQHELARSKDALADFVITMNRPLDYPDPAGRQLRFFQENYIAPDKVARHGIGFRVPRQLRSRPAGEVSRLGADRLRDLFDVLHAGLLLQAACQRSRVMIRSAVASCGFLLLLRLLIGLRCPCGRREHGRASRQCHHPNDPCRSIQAARRASGPSTGPSGSGSPCKTTGG